MHEEQHQEEYKTDLLAFFQQEWSGQPIWLWGVVGLVLIGAIVGTVLGATRDREPQAIGEPTAQPTTAIATEGEGFPDLEAAAEENPEDSEAHFDLGRAYFNSGRLEEAEAEFKRVIELDPDNAAAHHNLGVTYYQLQEPEAAILQFEKALKIDDTDPDTHYQLGATYLALALSTTGAPDEQLLLQATTEFETALQLREDMPEALIGLGYVSMQQMDYDDAIQKLSRAVEQAPNSPEAHFALADAYAQSGDKESACGAYETFMELEAPAAFRDQAQQRMEQLSCQ